MDAYQFQEGVFVYFETFTITDWLPIFINPEPIQILIDSLNFCIEQKHLRINAYVIMPNHVHLIVFDAQLNNQRLKQTLMDFRKFTGHKLANYIDNHLPCTLSAVIHDKNLDDRHRQVWQPGWHAEGVVGEKFWEQKINYIHMNPVKKGFVDLPEHWHYSSAGYWLNGEAGDVAVTDLFDAFE